MRNIIFLTIDALRADHLPFMGYKRNTTPFLHKIAEQGTIFTQAFANSSCTYASFPSIFSSDYPVLGNMYGITDRLTIQEILQDRGYQTTAFTCNPHLTRYYNYDKGFDYFEDFLGKIYIENESKKSINTSIIKHIGKFVRKYNSLYFILNTTRKTKSLLHPNKYNVPYIDALTLTKEVISWLKNQSKEPFFLWVHYMDPHGPSVYAPLSNKIQGQSVNKGELKKRLYRTNNSEKICVNNLVDLINSYDSRIRYVDNAIENLFAHIEKNNILNNSIVVITADHGEEFLDHGTFGHFPKLYDELIHIPLIIKGPNLPKGKKIDKLVQHLDIAPTILDMLGFSVPGSFLGENLFEETERQGIISEISNEVNKNKIDLSKLKVTYRSAEWKYIYSAEREDEFYNLKEDPIEERNLVFERSDKAEEYESKIKRHISRKKARYQEIYTERKRIEGSIRKLKKSSRL